MVSSEYYPLKSFWLVGDWLTLCVYYEKGKKYKLINNDVSSFVKIGCDLKMTTKYLPNVSILSESICS